MNEHDSLGAPDVGDATDADVIDGDAMTIPSVDELEGRLQALQQAMDQLQSGDLDGAEQAIESLEARVSSPPD